MEYITRQLYESPFSQSFFIFGPRGTGKSLWLKNRFPEALYIDLLKPDTRRQLEARPERLEELVKGSPDTHTIIIDEVQKVPDLLNLVHYLIEENKELQFILTVSSSRKLKRSGVDLLAGRAVLRKCHPFLLSELGDRFDEEKIFQNGLLPLIWNSPNPKAELGAYIDLYLKEEIQQEGYVRNLGDFSRFLETISFSQGSVLNQSEISRECEVERKTVSGYIEILEDMLLSIRLPVFTKRAKRRLIRHEKFYFFDTGVYRHLRPKGPLDKPSEIEGIVLEGLVMQHLRAWIDYTQNDTSLYYWRTKSGTEVDFILYGSDNFAAIEVKNSLKVRRSDLVGLKAFREDYPESQQLLLYRGKDKLQIDGIFCLPWELFLKKLTANQPLPFVKK
jgi:uncharacterized protein